MFNRLACASKSLALVTAILASSGITASAWTLDDTATGATLLDGVLRLFGDVTGAAKQAQAADIEADRRSLIAAGGCVVNEVQVAIKQVWGHDEAVKRFYEMVNDGAIARNLWVKCRPALRVSTWELPAVQQVVINVWNADIARLEQANERKAAGEKAMIEASKTYSKCLETTATQLALVSDEMVAAIFKAANVICADQREAIASIATSQGLGVAEAMDYAEKRGEEVAAAAVIVARTKAKAAGAESAPPQPQAVKHYNTDMGRDTSSR